MGEEDFRTFLADYTIGNSLANTLAYKWGYGDDVERFKREAMDRFSLLKDGTLDQPCTRLLLVNVRRLSSPLWWTKKKLYTRV